MKKTLCALSALSLLACTQAQAIPFGFAADGGGTFITQGYEGFDYTGGSGVYSWVNDTSNPIDGSYGVGPTALGAAWSNGGTELDMTSATPGGTFDVGSISLDIGHTANVSLTGYLGGIVVDSWSGTVVNQYAYTDISLNWTGIDKITMTSSGANLFVTNIDSATNIPEPAPLLLGAMGLVALTLSRRTTKR